MKYILLILLIFLTSCGNSARRSFFGCWKETAQTKVFVVNSSPLGYFTLTQHQSYQFDNLTEADLELQFTNTTPRYISLNFQINFQLNTVPTNGPTTYTNHYGTAYNGYWTYSNSIIRLAPNETLAFGIISNRIVNIKDGTIAVQPSSIYFE